MHNDQHRDTAEQQNSESNEHQSAAAYGQPVIDNEYRVLKGLASELRCNLGFGQIQGKGPKVWYLTRDSYYLVVISPSFRSRPIDKECLEAFVQQVWRVGAPRV